jgi:class 3 adenylate cyclase
MAELEAITIIESGAVAAASGSMPGVRNSGEPRQFSWRYPLQVGKVIRLGRVAGESDWVVEDPMVSSYHANLEWDGSKLKVKERAVQPPQYPREPANPIWFNQEKKKECLVGSREVFVIGQTRFTVLPDGDSGPASPVDGTILQHKQDLTRAELEGLPFTNPTAALKAMEQVPNVLRLAINEQTLFRQMLKVVLDALPRADSAGVVLIPPDVAPGAADPRVTPLDSHTKGTAAVGGGTFAPSRKLVHKAIKERKSCLHFWSALPDPAAAGPARPGAEPESEITLGTPHQLNTTPWAICTPFQDGSKCALYLSGKLAGQKAAADPKTIRDLTEYQKIAELLVGLLETTRKTHRLARQNALVRQAWPRGTWKFLDDPDQLEKLLKPREMDVTVLFCDLRGSSLFAEQGADALVKAWRNVAGALDDMSQAITVNEGVVAGFQGDAVMGFWGWPDAQEGQIEKALKAAARIQQVFTGWLADMKVGLGLAHGRAVAGRLGASDLAKVDVYGPVVNLASRLETMTKSFGVNVLVNEAVAAKLAEADPYGSRYRTRRLGRVRPKGMQNTFLISELLPAGSEKASDYFLNQWHESVDLFTAGDWATAYDRLENYFGTDPAAKCLMRVMEKTHKKPPDGWADQGGAFTPPPPEE